MKANTKTIAAAMAACAALLSSSAFAFSQTGTHVTYSFNDVDLGLFGPLSNVTVVGDDLVFAPTSFSTTSMATQTLNVTVTANAGYQLAGFSLAENGGYTQSGGSAYVAGSLTAIDVEGNSINNVVGSLAPSYNGTVGSWTAQTGVTLPAAGWGGADGIVGSVNLTLSNQLFAIGGAQIWKNAVTISAVAAPVPEVDTYAMMLVGLGVVGFMARRGRRFA